MNKLPSFLVVATSLYFGSVLPGWSLELTFGDFDDNGFEDLAIGCPLQSVFGEEGDLAEAGAVTVVYAGFSGLGAKSEVWHLGSPGIDVGAAAFDRFGGALAVGDYNGDGVADLAVGSPKLDESGEMKDVGAVTILFGSAGDGLAKGPLLRAKHIRRRSIGSTPTPNDRFGFALAAGDFDRDGSDDLAVGVIGVGKVNSFTASKGMVNVLYGPLFDPSQPVGISVIQSWSQGGGPGALEVEGKAEEDDRFGSALATGDFDGDGFADLAVGVPGEDSRILSGDSGAVNIIYGSLSGLREARNEIFTQDKDGVKGESDRKDAFGSVLAVGNFNGDANPLSGKPLDDLAVGIPSEDFQDEDFDFVDNADRGIVQVLYGNPDGLSTADQIVSEETPGLSDNALGHNQFGFAIAVGNFNGDRHPVTNFPLDDLAVGIPGVTILDTEGLDTEIKNGGAVAILFGSEDLLSGDRAYYLNQLRIADRPQDGDRFGMALAAGTAGNGSFLDLAVGVNDGPFGAAHVFYGTDIGPRKSNEELFFCLEEGTPNQPGEPRIPGAIPGGPGEGVFHFVNPIALADPSAEIPVSDSAFSPVASSYLFRFEGEGFGDGWFHDNQADSWDGRGISQFDSSPGGVDYRELGGDSFVRIQDTGDPREHGFESEPSNRTITIARDLRGEFGAADDLILDEGVTLHFRIRLATAFNGPLDGVHPAGGGEVRAVPVTGDGLVPDEGGFGHITIHQGSGPGMGNIGFSLAVPAADDPDGAGLPEGAGLVMNSLAGSSLSQDVDLHEGMRNNVHPVADPTQWQEFWITIQRHETFFSTHKVRVYHNGANQPQLYLVTAGDFGGDAPGGAGLVVSAGHSETGSALDVDFLRVIEGVVVPESEPFRPLNLLALQRNAEDQTFSLAWQSNRNEMFCVEQSANLRDWLEVAGGIRSEGTTTFFNAPLGEQESQYYQVRLERDEDSLPTLHTVPTINNLIVRGVAVAPDGTVYFSDEFTRTVQRIATDGTLSVVAGGDKCMVGNVRVAMLTDHTM